MLYHSPLCEYIIFHSSIWLLIDKWMCPVWCYYQKYYQMSWIIKMSWILSKCHEHSWTCLLAYICNRFFRVYTCTEHNFCVIECVPSLLRCFQQEIKCNSNLKWLKQEEHLLFYIIRNLNMRTIQSCFNAQQCYQGSGKYPFLFCHPECLFYLVLRLDPHCHKIAAIAPDIAYNHKIQKKRPSPPMFLLHTRKPFPEVPSKLFFSSHR